MLHNAESNTPSPDETAAMREYQAEKLASHANMARLRALRLAKEAEDAQAARAKVAHAPSKTPRKK